MDQAMRDIEGANRMRDVFSAFGTGDDRRCPSIEVFVLNDGRFSALPAISSGR